MAIIIHDNNILDVLEHKALSNNQIRKVGITNTVAKFGKKDINTTIDENGVYYKDNLQQTPTLIATSFEDGWKIGYQTSGTAIRLELYMESGSFTVSKIDYPFLKNDDLIWNVEWNKYYSETSPRDITSNLMNPVSKTIPDSMKYSDRFTAITTDDNLPTPEVFTNRGLLGGDKLTFEYKYRSNNSHGYSSAYTKNISITDPSNITVTTDELDSSKWKVTYNIATGFYVMFGGYITIGGGDADYYQIKYSASKVRFDVFTSTIELSTENKPTWYGDSSSPFTFEQSSNSLYQQETESYVPNTNLPQFVADTIINCWENGKETLTLDVEVDDYYDNGIKVKSIDENDELPMLFEIGEFIIPFIVNDSTYEDYEDKPKYANYPERPISEKDGIAKTFIIYDIETKYDGVCHQIIKCIEATYHEPHIYISSTNNIKLPFEDDDGKTFDANTIPEIFITDAEVKTDNYYPKDLILNFNGEDIVRYYDMNILQLGWKYELNGEDVYITYTPIDRTIYLQDIEYDVEDLYKLTIESGNNYVNKGSSLKIGDFISITGYLNEDSAVNNLYINGVRQNISVFPAEYVIVDGKRVFLSRFVLYPNYTISTTDDINISISTTNEAVVIINETEHAKVRVLNNGVRVNSGETVRIGSQLSITRIPEFGYTMKVFVNDVEHISGYVTVTGDVVISITEQQIPNYVLTLSNFDAFRTYSPIGASLGRMFSGDTIYQNDIITISTDNDIRTYTIRNGSTTDSGANIDGGISKSITVVGDVTATFVGKSWGYKAYSTGMSSVYSITDAHYPLSGQYISSYLGSNSFNIGKSISSSDDIYISATVRFFSQFDGRESSREYLTNNTNITEFWEDGGRGWNAIFGGSETYVKGFAFRLETQYWSGDGGRYGQPRWVSSDRVACVNDKGGYATNACQDVVYIAIDSFGKVKVARRVFNVNDPYDQQYVTVNAPSNYISEIGFTLYVREYY